MSWFRRSDAPEKNSKLLLVITSDDDLYLRAHEAATACEWEIRLARTVERGLQMLDQCRPSIAIYDWRGAEDDWRIDVDRLTAGGKHPCVLLASRVDDEYLRAELVRHGGFDVIPRSADANRLIRNIEFAYFHMTRGGRAFVR